MAEHNRSDVLLTDEVRELVALMKNSDIAELLIERGDAKVHLKRVTAAVAAAAPAPVYIAPAGPPPAAWATSVGAPAESVAESDMVNGVPVTAPMVGTFYASPSPKEPPYVQVGDEVKPGDVLGIIEAMKIMNEIECEVHGRVARVLVQNGQAVEYGQSLLIIEPL